jgi:hypothetical protein
VQLHPVARTSDSAVGSRRPGPTSPVIRGSSQSAGRKDEVLALALQVVPLDPVDGKRVPLASVAGEWRSERLGGAPGLEEKA